MRRNQCKPQFAIRAHRGALSSPHNRLGNAYVWEIREREAWKPGHAKQTLTHAVPIDIKPVRSPIPSARARWGSSLILGSSAFDAKVNVPDCRRTKGGYIDGDYNQE